MGLLLGTRLRGSYLSVVSAATPTAPGQEVDRYTAVRQYSLGEILIVWAAAAIPMGLLAWVVSPWLADRLGAMSQLLRRC
jgi:hypothetical protein